MAKGLPFFKFIVTEWLTGDIVYEELDVQGLFINICAVYWQRDGKISLDDIEKRFKKPELLNQLIDRFISVNDGVVSIGFLDEQLAERNNKSNTNSSNGSKGGRPHKSENGTIRFYLLECNLNDERFYKIGVTTETIGRRYSNTKGLTNKMPYNFLIIYDIILKVGDALSLKSSISDKFCRYFPKIKFAGVFDCFVASEKIFDFIQPIVNEKAISEINPTESEINPTESENPHKEEEELELEKEKEIKNKENTEIPEIKKNNGNNEYELKKSEKWLESNCMAYKIDIPKAKNYLTKFISKQIAADNLENRKLSDLKIHFANWLEIEIEKEKKLSGNKEQLYTGKK